MKLADLVDLEWLLRPTAEPLPWPAADDRGVGLQVCADAGLDPGAARARLDADPGLRRALCRAWLLRARQRLPALPGARIAQALTAAGWLLALLGIVLGVSSARAFLAYDGTVPVNVLHFAAFFFGVQILLLAAMVWFAIRSRRPGTGGGPGFLHQPIAFLAGRLLGARGREALAALTSLQARAALQRDIERWTLFALAQRLGVAFNVAALLTALATIAFTDLVFGWSTTLDLPAATFHAFVRVLALPWSFWDAAVPSLEVVQSSQWDRMQRAFVAGPLHDTVPLAAQWWRFLVTGLCVWGLLPRLCALGFGGYRARAARAAATLDHAGFQALYARLLPPDLGWAGPAADSVRGAAPARGPQAAPPELPRGAPTWVVVWGSLGRDRDRVARELARRLGIDVRATVRAGGADLDADAAAAAELRRAKAGRVVVAFAAGQQPTAEVLEFLQAVRAAIGRGRPLAIALLAAGAGGAYGDAAAEERAAWQRCLAAAGDPHLWVGALEATA